MKASPIISQVLLFILLLLNIGCEQPAETNEIDANKSEVIDKLTFYTRYAPSNVDIMPLTEFVGSDETRQSNIKIYVSLLDQFGSQIKSPGIFRFELYEHIPRSAEPKGKRVMIWPDIDLTDPVANNDYWMDFLRAYEFSLPAELEVNQDYILQLTCLCPNGKRLTSEFALPNSK